MQALRDLGWTSILFCPHNAILATRANQTGFETKTYNRRTAYDPVHAYTLAQLVRTRGAHVHAHDAHAHTLAWLSKSLFGWKQPLFVHRRVAFDIKDKWLTKWRYHSPKITQYIAVSNDVATCLAKTGVAQNRITTVYSGIDTQRIKPETGQLRQKLAVSENTVLVGQLAAITEQKNPFLFLRIAQEVLKSRQDVHFVWVGSGHLTNDFQKEIDRQGLSNNITCTGFSSQPMSCLVDFDVLLFTTQNEGLGTTILDALNMGVPVVTFDVPGAREAVPPNSSVGFCLPPHDVAGAAEAVMQLIDNKTLRDLTIASGHKHVESFDYRHTGQQIAAIYQKFNS